MIVLSAVLIGCGTLPPPSFAQPPPECNFPDDTKLSFGGTASLAEAGLSPGGGTADIAGELFVTAEPITIPEVGSNDPLRRFCIVYGGDAAISQMNGLVPDDWVPPDAP